MGIFNGLWSKGIFTLIQGAFHSLTSNEIDEDFRTGVFVPQCDGAVNDVYKNFEDFIANMKSMNTAAGA